MALRDTPGTILIPAGDFSGYTDFWICFDQLQQPLGTSIGIIRGANVADNFNRGLRAMKGEWVQLWGNDHMFAPGLLLALLDTLDAHPEVDVIIPLCSKRKPPFYPPFGVNWWEQEFGFGMQEMPWALVPPPSEGLFEVHQAGLPGAVIRRRVIEGIGDPWFEWNTLFDTTRTPPVRLHMGEDYYFCKKARDKGFRLFVDTSQVIGHIITPTLVPRWNKTRWVLDIVLEGSVISTIEQRVVHVERTA